MSSIKQNGKGGVRRAARLYVSGFAELWVNEQGRDLLVRELAASSAQSDHFHLGAFEGAEIGLGVHAYRPTDTVLHVGKVMFRPDEWDRTHFPHVMEDPIEDR